MGFSHANGIQVMNFAEYDRKHPRVLARGLKTRTAIRRLCSALLPSFPGAP
jgi:hypothetical protein